MLEPDITTDDFNEVTNSIEYAHWLDGVEMGHDEELISIDTPYAMGFEKL